MPKYKYRVLLESGKIGRGNILALNKSQAIESLKKTENQPIYLKRISENKKKYKRLDYNKMQRENKKNIEGYIKTLKKPKKKIELKNMTLNDLKVMLTRIKSKDILIFVNNLYILKKAKFNNVQALQAVFEGTENPAFKDVVEDLLIGVESGERLYIVMEAYPKVFPPMFINFIRVGEESGTLDTALLHARDYIEETNVLKKKVRASVIPRVLQFVGIMVAMIAALLIGVPLLEEVYGMFGSSQEIPAATLFGLKIAKWIVRYWYIIVLAIGGLLAGFFLYINTSMGRYRWDKFLLTAPILGPLMTNITVSKFFQAMLLNLKNGMRIQESLEVSKNVTSNYYFLSAVEAGKANSLSGESWLRPFEEKNLFKPMVSQMVEIGMKTDLAEMMEKVNEYIKMEIDESIARFVKALPDITYLFVGIAIIAFMITVMVPLVNVYMGGFIDMPT